jgi:rhamnulose-1-phosphate aldolase
MIDVHLPEKVLSEIKNISKVADFLWKREWVERNGGNISINLSVYFDDFELPQNLEFTSIQLPEHSGGMFLFVTGAGCYIRDLIHEMESASCILYINETATGYTKIWGGIGDNFKPTSELASHLEIHLFNAVNNPKNKAVLHAHPSELIMLSHHPIFADEAKLNKHVWQMCPEVRVYVPRGIHCTPYSITQSDQLAKNTIRGLKYRDVALWEKHGATTTAPTIMEAWDFLDVANKGAKLLLGCWASGFQPTGLNSKEIKDLEELFNL